MRSNRGRNGHTTERTEQVGESAAESRGTAVPSDRASAVAVFLACSWILVAAVQYVGADQRMRLLLNEPVPLPWLALVDLTVVYVLLLVATIVYAALRALRAPKDTETP